MGTTGVQMKFSVNIRWGLVWPVHTVSYEIFRSLFISYLSFELQINDIGKKLLNEESLDVNVAISRIFGYFCSVFSYFFVSFC